MVFGLVRKKKEYKIGDEVLPGKNIRSVGSSKANKVKRFGKAFAHVYVQGLKGTGRVLKEEYKKPGGKEVVMKILGVEPNRTIPELKKEIAKRKLQNELRELKKTSSDGTGMRILKSINVPDYVGGMGKIGSTTPIGTPNQKKKKAPWEII